jgi:hypothetical protein
MRTTLRILNPLCLLLAAVILAGCAGPTASADAAPEYVVTRKTAFYKLGPQQAGPPDQRLARNSRLLRLRREFGYSFVMLPTGETGYVANEDTQPAPPGQPAWQWPSPELVAPPPSELALPAMVEPALPEPDMGATPEDAPALPL